MTSLISSFNELHKALKTSLLGRSRQLKHELSFLKSSFLVHQDFHSSKRVAIISGYLTKTPPVGYGGVERSIYYLAKDLARYGWDVHLWGDFQDPAGELYEGLTLHHKKDFDGYDVLRIKPDLLYQAYPNHRRAINVARHSQCVIINEFNAIESLPGLSNKIYIRCMNERFKQLALAQGFSSERIINIPKHQGSEVQYQPNIPREEWILWVGRADPCKALEDAFKFSAVTGVELRFACPDVNLMNPGYARALWTLKPSSCNYLGEITVEQKKNYYSRCKALLYTAHPSWEEAFGQIFYEALASGTPILAVDYHLGSTQSLLFPGPPYGLRASSIEELAKKFIRHHSELESESVYNRFFQFYGNDKIPREIDHRFTKLVEQARGRSS